MFTGIITHTGVVTRIDKKGDWRFAIRAPSIGKGLAIGASIACNGACLTVVKKTADEFEVQVSKETLARTTLGTWKKGTRVNLERAMKAGDEFGGHFVTGHVDGLAAVEKVEKVGDSKTIWFSCHSRASGNPSKKTMPRQTALKLDHRLREDDNPDLIRTIAPKGSVTLDGVSFTVNSVKGRRFGVNIIPHTLKVTTLGSLKEGDRVNLEIDLIARYLARLKGK